MAPLAPPCKVLTVLGTRPEAIKLFPLLHALKADPKFSSRVCSTGQHSDMLAPIMTLADIFPDHELSVMLPGQSLDALTARLIEGLGIVLDQEQPDCVIVQGDTSTAFAGALSAHYRKIPIAHVEAGLRSGDLHHPWPEEGNRRMIARLAQWHFAPTQAAADALLAENVPAASVYVTGNTVIDALLWMQARLQSDPGIAPTIPAVLAQCAGRRIIAVTAHRRENLTGGIGQITDAVKKIACRDDVSVIWPLHANPQVRDIVLSRLGSDSGVHVLDPLGYPDFVALLSACHLVLTDSGGVQEEAPALGKPVLVARETTERPEGIAAGTARLVGTDCSGIVSAVTQLLGDDSAHARMAQAHNPYGDGLASGRITEILAQITR